jgi:hypothetical protein
LKRYRIKRSSPNRVGLFAASELVQAMADQSEDVDVWMASPDQDISPTPPATSKASPSRKSKYNPVNPCLAQVAAAKAFPQTPPMKDHVLRAGRLVKIAAKSRSLRVANKGSRKRVVASAHSVQRRTQNLSRQLILDSFSARASQSSASSGGPSRGAAHAGGTYVGDVPTQPESSSQLPHSPRITSPQSQNMDADAACDFSHLKSVIKEISNQRRSLGSSPWIMPSGDPFAECQRINAARVVAGEPLMTALEVQNVVFRPPLFLWAPTVLFPFLKLRCPSCNKFMDTHVKPSWGRFRILHLLHTHALFAATLERCSECSGVSSSCSLGIMKQLPANVQSTYSFVSAKNVLCDPSLMDLVRALAVGAKGWVSCTAAINEMKATNWARAMGSRYPLVCHDLGLEPLPRHEMPQFECVDRRWVRHIYMEDFQNRKGELMHELSVEKADDLLKLDWTKGAASRCGQPWLFNAMDGAGKVLASTMTSTTSPNEVRNVLEDLRARGCDPEVVYVDDECCGLWLSIVAESWRNAKVRLDVFHAIRRLAETTASTRHPWHGRFCGLISQAIFADDPRELERLKQACKREGKRLTLKMKSTFVPKSIAPATQIVARIEEIVSEFVTKAHPKAGTLSTSRMVANWENLRRHIQKGCLNDPAGVSLYEFDNSTATVIGDEVFNRCHSRRGTSALESFHNQQKMWLGPNRYSLECGLALLADGTQRYNRKRRGIAYCNSNVAQSVFAAGLLSSVDEGHEAYMARDRATCESPVRSLLRTAGTNTGLAAPGVSREAQEAASQISNEPSTYHEAQQVDGQAGDLLVQAGNQISQSRLRSQDAVEATATPGPRGVPSRCARSLAKRRVCRQCNRSDVQCRRYDGIYWCEAEGLSFEDWKQSIFLAKKKAAQQSKVQRAARASGARGRPKKKCDST